ncbi:hypothetical protein EOB36_26270 [Mesorhizobium sp. M6A.T.Cr.TU.017.01.1.1]|uniref:hypothetical protein n=1 Tax=Mesorhizobium sp. M6A.T.Cr.TU.017.01.1.1 TaxID=2496774 RepID=UPI000FD1F904|nr:hypothetical protein [Mesorhizobium sp. M6A.T.Cr.TU.017.01.1.1]RUU97650.1 hypothetical protein EOB36_26270 [Mesorhizobium sp. M6A.T.Cr.TU.017.01.1.1]
MTRGLSRTLSRAAAREAGFAPPKAGLAARTSGQGGAYRTVFSFNAMQVPVTDALAYASQKLFDFLDGKVRIKGGTARLQFAVLTTRASTINDNAALSWSLGSAAASSAALTGTMVNVLAATGRTLDGAGAALSAASVADVAAAATLDGTVTPVDLYLNLAFATGTDIDAEGTLAITGTITLLWENWGDNA